MPGIVSLVSAVSTSVNAALVAAGLPPLSDGQIVIGRVHVDENNAPPRVIFVPKGPVAFAQPSRPNRQPTGSTGQTAPVGTGHRSVTVTQFGGNYTAPTITFSAPQIAGGATAAAAVAVLNPNGGIKAIALTNAGSGYTAPATITITDATGSGASAVANLDMGAEKLQQLQQRSIFTEHTRFEVHCWAQATPPDPNNDFDACQALYQQVIASTWALAPGAVQLSAGDWLDSRPGATGVDLAGHYFVFGLEFLTPVLAANPVFAAGVGVKPLGQTSIIDFASGTAEAGPNT